MCARTHDSATSFKNKFSASIPITDLMFVKRRKAKKWEIVVSKRLLNLIPIKTIFEIILELSIAKLFIEKIASQYHISKQVAKTNVNVVQVLSEICFQKLPPDLADQIALWIQKSLKYKLYIIDIQSKLLSFDNRLFAAKRTHQIRISWVIRAIYEQSTS